MGRRGSSGSAAAAAVGFQAGRRLSIGSPPPAVAVAALASPAGGAYSAPAPGKAPDASKSPASLQRAAALRIPAPGSASRGGGPGAPSPAFRQLQPLTNASGNSAVGLSDAPTGRSVSRPVSAGGLDRHDSLRSPAHFAAASAAGSAAAAGASPSAASEDGGGGSGPGLLSRALSRFSAGLRSSRLEAVDRAQRDKAELYYRGRVPPPPHAAAAAPASGGGAASARAAVNSLPLGGRLPPAASDDDNNGKAANPAAAAAVTAADRSRRREREEAMQSARIDDFPTFDW